MYIYSIKYYSAMKKNLILLFAATWMALGNIMLSEISQSEKEKYCKIWLIYGIFKNTRGRGWAWAK